MEKEFIWYMKKFAKRFLSILLLSALTITYLFMLTGCFGDDGYKENGVTYELTENDDWQILSICDYFLDSEHLYIRDIINRKKVSKIGYYSNDMETHYFSEDTGIKAIRIYFPWSITENTLFRWSCDMDDVTKYIISASVSVLISDTTLNNDNGGGKYVIPKLAYDKLLEGYYCEVHQKESIRTENFIPANISYCFNYDSEPNEGYFFVDVLDETGKLTKPPYDPQRKWYKFDGWYTEPECVNEWDFDNDEVTISYDESGNRIYEEIKLYAKWKWSLFAI